MDIHREVNQLLLHEVAYIVESGWLEHLPFAYVLAYFTAPRILVELGSYRGASYFAFCQAIKEHGIASRCFAIDTWEGDKHCGVYGEDVFAGVARHNTQYPFSTLIRERFDVAVTLFDDGSVDLLHIDGLHTYDAVREDFDMWLPKMSNRGIMLFHDTMVRKRDFGVWRLWKEIQDGYLTFEFPTGHGLGIAVIGNNPNRGTLRLIEALKVDRALQNTFRIAGTYYDTLGKTLKPHKKKKSSTIIFYRRLIKKIKKKYLSFK